MEARLKKAHNEETLSQLKASQLSIEVVKSQAELDAKEKMSEDRLKFEREKQILENELLRRRKEEIGKVKNDFEAQLSALKLQVEKSDELRTKEVRLRCLNSRYIAELFTCQPSVIDLNLWLGSFSLGSAHLPMQNSYCDHRNFDMDSVNMPLHLFWIELFKQKVQYFFS